MKHLSLPPQLQLNYMYLCPNKPAIVLSGKEAFILRLRKGIFFLQLADVVVKFTPPICNVAISG